MANDKPSKSCQECVLRHQSPAQGFGTHDRKGKIPVNHPPCGCCAWARAVTGRGQLVDCIEYVQISDRR
jgi:hypothetical protein